MKAYFKLYLKLLNKVLYSLFIIFLSNIWDILWIPRASLVAQMVKRLPAVWETQVQFLGQEDPLKKQMAIHSSTVAWKIPRTDEPGMLWGLWGPKESDTAEWLHDFTITYGEVGLGNHTTWSLPWWSSSWDFTFQCGGCRFNPWMES